MKIIIKITGKPIAKKRPRFARRGKFVAVINDQETEEGRFFWELKNQFKNPPFEKALVVRMWFYMPIPKSLSQKKRAQIEQGLIPHTKKPDIDNLQKFAFDCCNGVIWKDDSQIISVKADKLYSDIPQTEIYIEEVETTT